MFKASPHANVGDFRALLAVRETGKNDSTGLRIDRNNPVHVEGKGFVGAVNLLDLPFPLREFHTVEFLRRPAVKGVQFLSGGALAFRIEP